jgi:hypothetical protein
MADTPEQPGRAGIKDLFKMIVKSPALLITFLFVIGIVIYLLVKNSGGGSSQQSTTSTTTTSTPVPGAYWNENQHARQQVATGQTQPTTTTTTTPVTTATTTPIVPTQPASGSPVAYTDQSGQATSIQPYLGLLGPNVAVNFQSKTYTENGKQVPLPGYVGKLIQGSDNRDWYIDTNTGAQDLLTSGYGPGVTNSGYAPGSPQNTPVKKS